MPGKLSCQRHLFDIPEEVHYLNCAYMSPLMRQVNDIGVEMLGRKVRPFEIDVDDFFAPIADLKKKYAALIGSGTPDRIAIIPSVSYGLANVVHNIDLRKGQNVVVAAEQFPSNIYPWQALCEKHSGELKVIARPKQASLWSEAITKAIDENTVAVALGHVHWADGYVFDLVRIAEAARIKDALVIIDGTQSVGALPFPFESVRPDALICAGYKWLMGPYSIGLAYYGPWFDDKMPVENNWINRLNSDDFKGLVNYEARYRPAANRFNVGECSNFTHVPMLSKAVDQLTEWGIENIQEYCAELLSPFQARWREMGLNSGEGLSGSHLFGLRLPASIDINHVKSALNERNVHVSLRGDAIRVSPHLYNTSRDLEALTSALETVLQN